MRQQLTFWLAIFLGIAVFYAIRSGFGGREMAHNRSYPDIARGIKSALDSFKVDNGYYPIGTNGLLELCQKPDGATNWHGPYFDPPKLPVDPWGNKYIYEYPGKHNTNGYDLFSAGPDGKAGTEDDIVNWAK